MTAAQQSDLSEIQHHCSSADLKDYFLKVSSYPMNKEAVQFIIHDLAHSFDRSEIFELIKTLDEAASSILDQCHIGVEFQNPLFNEALIEMAFAHSNQPSATLGAQHEK